MVRITVKSSLAMALISPNFSSAIYLPEAIHAVEGLRGSNGSAGRAGGSDNGSGNGSVVDVDYSPRGNNGQREIGGVVCSLHMQVMSAMPMNNPSYHPCDSPEEYCFADVGRCADEDAAGDGLNYGTCQPMPTECDDEYNPVCGCDEITYSNACEAASQGINARHIGECEEETPCSPANPCDYIGIF